MLSLTIKYVEWNLTESCNANGIALQRHGCNPDKESEGHSSNPAIIPDAVDTARIFYLPIERRQQRVL